MRKMKESGVEWLGEVPNGWDLVQLGSLFTEHKNKNLGLQSDNLLSLSYGNIVRKNIATTDGLLPESFEGYNVIDDGDIVLRLTDLQNDQRSLRVGLSHEKGIVTSAYVTLRKRDPSLNSQFFYYLIHSYDVRKGFYGMGAGVRQGLNFTGIRKIMLVLPSADEQNAISIFLGEKISKVEKLITNIKSQINKLKAYKQSLITEVVTKGLDSSVTMRESGVEWVSQIPATWKMSRVGLHYTIILGKMLCPNQLEDNYTLEKYYCAANVHFGEIISDELKEMWFSPVEKEQYRLTVGDMLIVEGGAGAGGCAIVKQPTDALVQNSVMIVRNRCGNDNRYLRYWIESMVKRGYLDVVCNKATIPHYTKDKLANTIIPIVPFAEQIKIADYLDTRCEQVNRLVATKQAKIEKLEEYKKSMIYEYVTGKKEVQ